MTLISVGRLGGFTNQAGRQTRSGSEISSWRTGRFVGMNGKLA